MSIATAFRSSFSRRKMARFLGAPSKSEAALWLEAINPLSGLTVPRAIQIFDQARLGCYTQLQWLYQEIEAADPTLLVCSERRAAGVAEIDWTIETLSAARVGSAKWDKTLAAEQQAYLEGAIGACTNLLDGIEHIGAAFFCGFAHATPRYSLDGLELQTIETLDAWNFCLDRHTGSWLWNPDCRTITDGTGLEAIPDTELLTLRRPRHIDYPALAIYIRSALGEAQWGRFMERYGIPPVMIVMPEFAEDTDEARYMEAANKVARGGSGALPFGSSVSYATEARNVNPFSDYLKHQQELIVLMATGGLLTSLAQAGSGTLAGGAHEDSWESVVARDSRVIAAALNRRVVTDLLNRAYPGRHHLARFGFETEASPTPAQVFETAGKATAAGWRVTQAELTERTGYALEPMPQAVGISDGLPMAGSGIHPRDAAQAAATDGDIQQASLNGAQVQALQQILGDVSRKQLPVDAAIEMLAAAFPLLAPDRIRLMVQSAASFTPAPMISNKSSTSSATIETAAVDALAEARAQNLAPVIDRLLDALAETDDAAMRAALQSLYADLPALAATLDTTADTSLIERILADAVGSGYAESTTQKGAKS